MKKFLIIGVVIAAAYFLLRPGGSGSGSGRANFTIDGTQYQLDDMEFRVEVNPRLGETNPDTVITEGSPQAIRFIVRNSSWPKLDGGKGFSISWWMRGDDPIEELESIVGQAREHDPRDVKVLNLRVAANGKTMRGGNHHRSWLKITDTANGVATGIFGGKLEVEPENLSIDTLDSKPEFIDVQDGYFMIPISLLYTQK